VLDHRDESRGKAWATRPDAQAAAMQDSKTNKPDMIEKVAEKAVDAILETKPKPEPKKD
jgi:hypothetical protein